MFEKLVAIEPLNITDESRKQLAHYAKRIEFYTDKPTNDAEIIHRIGAADGVLVSYTTPINAAVINACPAIKYIGMCCSLYSPQSANVDITAANKQGVTVLGVRDYGDEGVVEFVVSELVQLLHGFGPHMWKEHPMELTGVRAGILGMGTTGSLVARGLQFFGASIHYYSRTRKPEMEQENGYTYLPLNELLPKVDVLCTCLNKNVVLLHQPEFVLFGDGKILVNISIAPPHNIDALRAWLTGQGNFAIGDTMASLDPSGSLLALSNVICPQKSAGLSTLSLQRLGQKVIANIETFFAAQPS
jgi:lactate dehydrogenase-like 2-hydroxyacid dehydrogenase